MNFYTQVLSRFVASSALRLQVSFEAKTNNEQAERSLEDTRRALRDLGLDTNARIE